MTDTLLALVTGLALGLLAGWGFSRGSFRRQILRLEAYLRHWLDDESSERGDRAPRRGRILRNVFSSLEEHRASYLDLRSLSSATHNRLQTLMDVLDEEVLIYNADAKLLFASVKIREMALEAAASETLAGAERAAAIPPSTGADEDLRRTARALADASDIDAWVRSCLATEGELEGREVTVRAVGGDRRFFSAPHRIPAAGDATALGLLLVLVDYEVVDELRQNAVRRVALEHVRLAAELLAHRARNPLHSIVLIAEVIRREAGREGGAERVQRNLGTIQTEVGKLESTLDRFLEMIRRRAHATESVDLVAVVETVAELLYALAREARLVIRQELNVPSAPVRGDGVEITRALLGPALAALREATPGTELKLRLDSDRRDHLLFLDTGGARPSSMEFAAAEELAARNGGSLTLDDPRQPGRLTYRYHSAARSE